MTIDSSDLCQLPVVTVPDNGATDAPWTVPPDWPSDVSNAVAQRLLQLKSQLLNIVVKDLNKDKGKDQEGEQRGVDEEGWLDLRSLLNLDAEYLKTLESSNSSACWLLRSFESWIKAELEELFTEQQRLEFRESGLSPLLAQIEYPWETELVRKLAVAPAASCEFGDAIDRKLSWSTEQKTAVARRLFKLKSELLGIVVKNFNNQRRMKGQAAQPVIEQEGWLQLQPFLNLDDQFLRNLQTSNPTPYWLLSTFEGWIKTEIEEFLTEQQRLEFQNVTIGSLLSRIDYPWQSELINRLKKLPTPRNEAVEDVIAAIEAGGAQSETRVTEDFAAGLDWSQDLRAKVEARLLLLKSQLIDLIIALIQPPEETKLDHSQQETNAGGREGQVQQLLNLDEGYLKVLASTDSSSAWLPRMFGSWTENLIDELLTEDQRREFRNVGIGSLLSLVNYPWEIELTLRLNGLSSQQIDTNSEPTDVDATETKNRAIAAFSGSPDWPASLKTAVAKRLFLLKAQLVEIVAELLGQLQTENQPAVQPQKENKEKKEKRDEKGELQLLLNLDEGYMQSFEASNPGGTWLLRTFGAWTETLIDELLTAQQRQEFRQTGISALLSRIEFPWDTELVNCLNRSNADDSQSDYRGLFCPRPFQYVEIGPEGRTHLCCAVMLPTIAGDHQTGTFMDVWNSEKAQEIRKSILDGTFEHCVEHLCPDLRNRSLPKREDVKDPFLKDVIANSRTVLSRGPERITMNYDISCNLACPMCRTERISLKGAEKRTAEEVQQWATREHLKDARELVISTAGDAFGSATYHSFLRTFDASPYPELRLRLLTNGLHLTPKSWERICNENVDTIHVSIDAATPETYRENRGADFDRLVKNLHFIGSLRTSGQIKTFIFNYTVQENNFAEMPQFVMLASSVCADQVLFIQLANGTFTEEVYRQRAIHQPSHPRHGELLEVLKNPLLRMPMVQLQLLETLCT